MSIFIVLHEETEIYINSLHIIYFTNDTKTNVFFFRRLYYIFYKLRLYMPQHVEVREQLSQSCFSPSTSSSWE